MASLLVSGSGSAGRIRAKGRPLNLPQAVLAPTVAATSTPTAAATAFEDPKSPKQ